MEVMDSSIKMSDVSSVNICVTVATLGISVVDRSQGVEPLLARGVPDGEVDRPLAHLHLLVHEGGLQHNPQWLQLSPGKRGERLGPLSPSVNVNLLTPLVCWRL